MFQTRGMMGGKDGPNGIFKIGKSPAKLQTNRIKIKFSDVAGCEEGILAFYSLRKQY